MNKASKVSPKMKVGSVSGGRKNQYGEHRIIEGSKTGHTKPVGKRHP
jgi:hypothetical protein